MEVERNALMIYIFVRSCMLAQPQARRLLQNRLTHKDGERKTCEKQYSLKIVIRTVIL